MTGLAMERSGEMEIFVRVVREGGFSAAARNLGLTPSAVSKVVARLETRLGTRLLLRSTRVVRLTEEGEAYFEASQRVLKALNEAEHTATAEGVAKLVAELPAVDILVNNLGVYESKAFAEISDADWFRFFETNVMSGVRLSRAYFPGMIARNWGRILFVSSESGLSPAPDMIHYGVTKTAQLALTRGLATATKGTGVTVNAVLPGPTRSEGIIDFLKSVSSHPEAPAAEIEAEFFEKHRPASLLQRMIEPEEVAHLVAYLASPLSSATNGDAVRVEGGLLTTIG